MNNNCYCRQTVIFLEHCFSLLYMNSNIPEDLYYYKYLTKLIENIKISYMLYTCNPTELTLIKKLIKLIIVISI